MTDDRRLDGNALAGVLRELFGREMTEQLGCCGRCGAVNALGASHVYLDAPGQVIRCPSCESVLIVMVQHPNGIRVSFVEIRWLETQTEEGRSTRWRIASVRVSGGEDDVDSLR